MSDLNTELFSISDLSCATGIIRASVRWHLRKIIPSGIILNRGNKTKVYYYSALPRTLRVMIEQQAFQSGFGDIAAFILSKRPLQTKRSFLNKKPIPNLDRKKRTERQVKLLFLEMLRKRYLDQIGLGVNAKKLRRELRKIAWQTMWQESRCPWPSYGSFRVAIDRVFANPGQPVRDLRENNGRKKQTSVKRGNNSPRQINLIVAAKEIQNET